MPTIRRFRTRSFAHVVVETSRLVSLLRCLISGRAAARIIPSMRLARTSGFCHNCRVIRLRFLRLLSVANPRLVASRIRSRYAGSLIRSVIASLCRWRHAGSLNRSFRKADILRRWEGFVHTILIAADLRRFASGVASVLRNPADTASPREPSRYSMAIFAPRALKSHCGIPPRVSFSSRRPRSDSQLRIHARSALFAAATVRQICSTAMLGRCSPASRDLIQAARGELSCRRAALQCFVRRSVSARRVWPTYPTFGVVGWVNRYTRMVGITPLVRGTA
jgi:hypothetical protein